MNVNVVDAAYLDCAATTAPLPIIINSISAYAELYGNPSSLHLAGQRAKMEVEDAREKIASYIGAQPDEIFFTSGGTEANNWALRGMVKHMKESGKTTILTSMIEHHSVLDTCKALEAEGIKTIYMPVDADGRVDIEELDKVLRMQGDEIGLVYIMAVNNEVGSIQLIDDIGDLCEEYGILFGTDAVQALTHIPLDVKQSNISLMAMSGHKINGLKGTGALYVRKGTPLSPVLTGGGQQGGLRPGTENTVGIIAMGQAIRFSNQIDDMWGSYVKLRRLFLKKLDELGVEYRVNCPGGVPNIISLTLPHCESEAVLLLLNARHVYVSAGAACTAGQLEPSHVLRALYMDEAEASCTIRISMDWRTSGWQMKKAAEAIADAVQQLKAMGGDA